MKLKKLFAGILAVAMMATMAAPAFAAESVNMKITETDAVDKVTIAKDYAITTEGSTAPDETFQLKQVEKTYDKDKTSSQVKGKDDVPNLEFVTDKENIVAEVSSTAANPEFTINLPEYDYVGVYTYTLEEVDNATAGVDYQTEHFQLTVYAFQGTNGIYTYAVAHKLNDGDTKVKDVDNRYTAGTLTVKKEVTGELGEQDRLFDFTVTLNAPEGKTVLSTIKASHDSESTDGKEYTFNDDGTLTITFKLKHGDDVTISNIPYDVTYTVKEDATEGYTTTAKLNKQNATITENGVADNIAKVTSDAGAVSADADEITFINNKGGNVDTGVILDNAPYIALMMVVVAGAAVMVIKKRRHYED